LLENNIIQTSVYVLSVEIMAAATVLSQNQGQFTIDEITTQIVVTSYLDRHFVIVTQLKKLGTLVRVRTDTFFLILLLKL
jgi:hypothetical protein